MQIVVAAQGRYAELVRVLITAAVELPRGFGERPGRSGELTQKFTGVGVVVVGPLSGTMLGMPGAAVFGVGCGAGRVRRERWGGPYRRCGCQGRRLVARSS